MIPVDIVIPHYGPDSDLQECLKSIPTEYALDTVINRKDYGNNVVSRLQIIDNNKENRGFTKAVNLGIANVLDCGSEYVAIVNNDVIALENPFQPMLEFMEQNPKCGIIGPKIVHHTNHDQIVHAGGEQVYPNGIHRTGSVSLGQWNKACRVKWLSFVVVVIRKSAIVRTGLLDEHFFLVCSDSDYCYRLRYEGYDCWYCPDSVWSHRIGESGVPTSEKSMKIQRKDTWQFYKKWKSDGVFEEIDKEFIE